jgi:hypothetical protein
VGLLLPWTTPRTTATPIFNAGHKGGAVLTGPHRR